MSGRCRPHRQVRSGGPPERLQVGADAAPGRPAEGPGQTGAQQDAGSRVGFLGVGPPQERRAGTIWGPLCGSGPGVAEAGSYLCFSPPSPGVRAGSPRPRARPF